MHVPDRFNFFIFSFIFFIVVSVQYKNACPTHRFNKPVKLALFVVTDKELIQQYIKCVLFSLTNDKDTFNRHTCDACSILGKPYVGTKETFLICMHL